jgi:hypothetical protein
MAMSQGGRVTDRLVIMTIPTRDAEALTYAMAQVLRGS